MINRELIEALSKEPLDDEVGIAYEGTYTTVISLTETVVFANDPGKRQRILLLEEDDGYTSPREQGYRDDPEPP